MGWKVAGVLVVLCGYAFSVGATTEDEQLFAMGIVFAGCLLLAQGSALGEKRFLGVAVGPAPSRHRRKFAFLAWMILAMVGLVLVHVLLSS